MGFVDLHLYVESDLEKSLRMAKFLGFSTLGLDLKGKLEEKRRVAELCKKEKIDCFFREGIDEAKKGRGLDKYDSIFTVRNVGEAKSFRGKFDIIESGKTIKEVLETNRFCSSYPNTWFVVEFDFAPLRSHCGPDFAEYIHSLGRLMKTCNRRNVTTIFSSAAQSYLELTPPRLLYYLYMLLGGHFSMRKIISEVPLTMLKAKSDLEVQIMSGLK